MNIVAYRCSSDGAIIIIYNKAPGAIVLTETTYSCYCMSQTQIQRPTSVLYHKAPGAKVLTETSYCCYCMSQTQIQRPTSVLHYKERKLANRTHCTHGACSVPVRYVSRGTYGPWQRPVRSLYRKGVAYSVGASFTEPPLADFSVSRVFTCTSRTNSLDLHSLPAFHIHLSKWPTTWTCTSPNSFSTGI